MCRNKRPLAQQVASHFRKKIAGHVFGLENRYPEVEKTCRKYLCHEQPEAVFSVSQQKTDSLHLDRSDGENESTALHACIVQHLIPQGYFPSTLIPDSAEVSVPGDSVAGSKADAFSLRLKALDLMGKLTHLPIYELHCTISQQAVTLTLGALQENTPK